VQIKDTRQRKGAGVVGVYAKGQKMAEQCDHSGHRPPPFAEDKLVLERKMN
jgi:hypothetical protein